MHRDFKLSNSDSKITCFEGNISRHLGNMYAVSLGNKGMKANRILGVTKSINDLAESEVNINILDRQPVNDLHFALPAKNNWTPFS